jgi:GTPase
MFIDEVKIFAQAGHGGAGCVAFHREAYRPKGGPSGGDGGRGGSVVLQADHDLNNLIAQYYAPRLIAERGENGKGKGMDGRSGQDIIVNVPCGTLVWRVTSTPEPSSTTPVDEPPSDRPELIPVSHTPLPQMRYQGSERALEVDLSNSPATEENVPPPHTGPAELVIDLVRHQQQFVLCHGGRGGLGNRHFATARHQTPRFAQPGEPGEEGHYLFELRLMAEVGLVGYPNAGKSTLLTALTRAKPKIAPYPFTTLKPQVGMVEYSDLSRLTICDVPGLIKGAHQNVGLGHSFLRHIRRCKILVILLDMAGADGRLPWEDYRDLLAELELYDPGLLQKPRLVVANKIDETIALENLKKFKRHIRKVPVLSISAAFGEGLDRFKQDIRQQVEMSRGPEPSTRILENQLLM